MSFGRGCRSMGNGTRVSNCSSRRGGVCIVSSLAPICGSRMGDTGQTISLIGGRCIMIRSIVRTAGQFAVVA